MKHCLVRIAALAAAPVFVFGSEPARSGGELRMALRAEPKTFDPYLASDEPSALIRYLTSGVLVRINRATQMVEPELAVSWRATEAGRRIVFRLREGVTFSEGSPFTAADVCFSFRRLMDPALESPVADSFESAKGKITCREENPASVSLQLPAPMAGFERLLDEVAIQSSRARDRQAAFLGPFVVSERRAGTALALARNQRYWKKDPQGRALPYLDSIRFEIQRNRDLELVRFHNGEFQLVNDLDPELFERVRAKMPAAARAIGASLDSEQIWFNQAPSAPLPAHKKAWFTSTGFRFAISNAIHREDLARIAYHGHAGPAAGPISPANQFWFNQKLKPAAADPPAALARLAREGFRLEGKVLKDKEGHPVEFSIITNAGNKSRERMASLIQQDLRSIGIQVNIVPLDFPSLIDRITKTFQYDACLLGQVNSDLDPNGQMNVWLSSGANHQWSPNQKSPGSAWEAEIDRLMLAQAAELDPARRKQSFDRVQQIVAEQNPFIYLVHRDALAAVSLRLKNVRPSVLFPQLLWNAEQIYLEVSGGSP